MIGNGKFERARNTVTCPRCGATPGEPCVRADGQAATTIHNERLRAAGFGDQSKKVTA